MPKIVVYSAICGNKDKPRNDVLCFMEDKFKDPVLSAKIYKVLPHLFLDCDYSIWIDGNITLKVPPETLIDVLEKDIAVFPHPSRDCLFDEGRFCVLNQIGNQIEILEQLKRYKGFPNHYGLAGCGVLIRKHTDKMRRLSEQWWAEICRGSIRDQISFPYVFKDEVQYLEPIDFWDNKYWKRVQHAF